jgi:hypothetical protein
MGYLQVRVETTYTTKIRTKSYHHDNVSPALAMVKIKESKLETI